MRTILHLGLRGRLILPLLAVFLLLSVMIAWHLVEHHQERMQSASDNLLNHAKLIASRQQSLAAKAEVLLNSLMEHPDLRPALPMAECSPTMASFLERNQVFVQAGWAQPDGEVACAAHPPTSQVSFGDRRYFQRALQATGMVTSEVITGRILDLPVIVFAKARRDDLGRVVAVYFLSFDVTWLNRELVRSELPEGTQVMMVDHAGAVVAQHPEATGWGGKNIAHLPMFKHIMAEGGQGVVVESGVDGKPMLVAFSPLLNTVSGPLRIFLSAPKDLLNKYFYSEILNASTVSVIILSALMAGVLWSYNRYLVRPLTLLSKVATRFGAGQFSVGSGLPHSSDEIGRLARALDETAQALLQAEERASRSAKLKVALSQTNQAIVRIKDKAALFERVCRIAQEYGGFRWAWIAVPDWRSGAVQSVAWVGNQQAWATSLPVSLDPANPLSQGVTGRALLEGHPQWMNDVRTDDWPEAWRELFNTLGLRAAAAVPIRCRQQVTAALSLYSDQPGVFDAEAQSLLTEMAMDISFALDTLLLEEERRQNEIELRQHNERMAALLHLTESSRHMSETEVIQQALEEAVHLTDSKIGYFHLVDEACASIELTAWSKTALENCVAPFDKHYPLEQAGIWADSARLRQPVVHNDYPTQPGSKGLPPGHAPIRRHLSVPVIDEAQVVCGIMGVGNKESPYDEADARFLHVFATDLWQVIQRQREQTTLRESEEKFRILVETTADWIWAVDAQGRYTYASPRLKDLLGYEPDEIIGKTPFDLMPPDEAARVAFLFGHYAEHRLPFSMMENLNLHKNGREVFLESSGAPIIDEAGVLRGFRGIDRDITGRKLDKAALREHEDIFYAITSSSQDAIIMIDDQDRITFWNQIAEKMFGYASEEVLDRALHPLLVPPRFAAAHDAALPDFLATGRGAAIGNTLELAALHRDGTEFPIELSLSAIWLKERWCAIGFIRNISDRKRIQERDLFHAFQTGVAETGTTLLHNIGNAIMSIAYRAEHLQHKSRRLIKTGEVLANMGATVQERLANGQPAIQVLQELALALEETGQGFLQDAKEDFGHTTAKIQAGVEHIASIIKIHQGAANPIIQKSEFNLVQMVEDAFAIQSDLLEKYRIETRIDIQGLNNPVFLPRSQMLQVMINLIKNAREAIIEQRRATPIQGLITVKAGRLPSGSIEILICDNGCGIPEQHLKSIFNIGFTTKSSSNGIGLHSAATFIQSQGGEIYAHSQGVGEGTTMVIQLPIAVESKTGIFPSQGQAT